MRKNLPYLVLIGFLLGLDASWSQVYETTPVWSTRLARPPEQHVRRAVRLVGPHPDAARVVGPRVAHGMQTETLFVENKPFELTLEVDKFRLLDDQWGLYANMAAQMGWQSAKWPDQQLAAAVTRTSRARTASRSSRRTTRRAAGRG
jgi:hypothetical protein